MQLFTRKKVASAAPAMAPSAPARDDHIRVTYRSVDEIAALENGFKRVLKDLNIGQVINTVCPVELVDGSVTIFVTADYFVSDQIDVVREKVLAKGKRLATPWRAIVTAAIIQSFVSEKITATTLKAKVITKDESAKSALLGVFNELVAWGVAQNASDLHLNVRDDRPDSEVRFHINGRYIAPELFQKIPSQQLLEMLNVAYQDISGGLGSVFDRSVEQQGRLSRTINGRPIMLRWASMATDNGPSVTMRILKLDEQSHATLEHLGYLPGEVAMLERAQLAEGGALVMAGVVGSGKSTTIASLLSRLPDTRKVITIEDPVEYRIPNALQNSVVRSLTGGDTNGFDSKLKTVKRSAMQDLLIGEIRDQETGRAFMDVSGSGTSVYTTVHANSVLLIADRLASDFIGVSREFLATPGVLKLLVYQALLPKLCQHCALPLRSFFTAGGTSALGRHEDGAYWQDYVRRLERLYGLDVDQLRVRNPEGCRHCINELIPALNGLTGRTVVSEMLEPSLDDEFLRCIKVADGIAMRNHFATKRAADFTDPNMDGKTAMECAVYKASIGLIDPREIEPRFRSFETAEMAMAQTPPRQKAPLTVIKPASQEAANHG